MDDGSLSFRVRVRPGARVDRVGGTWGDGSDAPLNVWVSKPAVDGAANEAVLRVLATTLQVRRRQLTIVQGYTNRTKTVRVDEPPQDFERRLAAWRNRV